ncbi:MAG: isochorismatase family protein [Ilumatobacteraceae bacterium]
MTRVIVCGLASDVCVAASAKDAFAAGFATVVRWDLSRPVFPDTAAEVRRDLEALGVEVLARAGVVSGVGEGRSLGRSEARCSPTSTNW